MSRFTQVVLYSVSILLLAAVVIFLEIPEKTRFWFELFTAGHTLVFGLCALSFVRLSLLVPGARFKNRLTHYVVALILSVIVGAVTEIIQSYVGRDGELADLYRDMLGAVAFLFVAMTFDQKLTWEFRTGRWLRHVVRALGPVLIIVIFWPAMKWGGAYLYRDRQMPVLLQFDSTVMRLFTRVANGRLEIVDPPSAWSSDADKVALLTLYPGFYPGLTMRELSPDWSPYKEIQLSIFSPRTDTLTLEFRVNDRHHNEKYADRFNTVLKIKPGENTLEFPLERVRKTPSGRTMDLTDMGTVVLFAHRPADSISIYLSDIRLQ
jgi:hypothetical protein